MTKGRYDAVGPDWDHLYEMAASQDGFFTTAQAAEAAYYPALLAKYLRNGRIIRVRYGIYRIVHFPAGEHEDLVVVWLWTARIGTFSHQTALLLHELSDVLPTRAHVTVPLSWKNRRLRVPDGVELHFADVGDSDRAWIGAVRVTTVARTLIDCVQDSLSPDLVRDAFKGAVNRGLVDRDSIPTVSDYLARFSSKAWRKAPQRSESARRRTSRHA